MRNSIGTAVVLLKAPLGGFRGGLRGSDTGSEPAGLTDSVTNSYCSNRILYSACDYDLFTYQLLNILWSFTFITYDTLDNMISLSLLYSFVWTFFFFSNPSKINKKKKDKFLSNICCIRLEMDTVSLPMLLILYKCKLPQENGKLCTAEMRATLKNVTWMGMFLLFYFFHGELLQNYW